MAVDIAPLDAAVDRVINAVADLIDAYAPLVNGPDLQSFLNAKADKLALLADKIAAAIAAAPRP